MWKKLICLSLLLNSVYAENKRPHIIVIIADDLGFNDIGFHGSDEIPTPNIDALAYNGVILNSHYTQALCTPSRSAFLTGKYPIHLGMQHLLIEEAQPWGLPLNETLLPQYLKKHGYATHAIGKWHLGFFKKEYTPTFRGFDTHFGYWQGFQDYYDHTAHATFGPENGYDMRRNMTTDWSAQGQYSTTLFTDEAVKLIKEHNTNDPMFMYFAHLATHTGNKNDPLQAPDEEIAKFSYIQDPERRVYAAMVSMLDQSVGSVIGALREKHMLEDSIILFMSDNGAPTFGIHANHGSNYPFRGQKNSQWEGAMRGVAAVWSPLIKKPQRVSNHLMHLTDWLPTLFTAAGLDKNELPEVDGYDMWSTISEDVKSPRADLVYNIDDIINFGAYRQGDWKYVYGSSNKGTQDQWYGVSGKDPSYSYDINAVLESQTATTLAGFLTFQQINEMKQHIKNGKENTTDFKTHLLNPDKVKNLRTQAEVTCKKLDPEEVHEGTKCEPLQSPCLFNLKEDPCERRNLANERPIIVANMEQFLIRARRTALPPRNLPRDLSADPALYNNTWICWKDCDIVAKYKKVYSFNALAPLTIGLISAACFGFFLVVVILAAIAIKKKSRNGRTPLPTEEDFANPEKANPEPKTKFFEDREIKMHQSLKNDLRTLE